VRRDERTFGRAFLSLADWKRRSETALGVGNAHAALRALKPVSAREFSDASRLPHGTPATLAHRQRAGAMRSADMSNRQQQGDRQQGNAGGDEEE
jgi:hypothetical protein